LDEHDYGTRNESGVKPFDGVTVYLHSSFMASRDDKVKAAQQLIELAGGQLVDSTYEREPTHRLVSREHGKTKPFDILFQELLRLLTTDQQQQQQGDQRRTNVTPQLASKKRQRLRVLNLSDGDEGKE
jgi:hypothetical protein